MDLDTLAIENFREFIRIPSITNQTDYEDCVKFLIKQAKSIGLEYSIIKVRPNKPVVVLKWIGLNPGLTSIMLNCHMDVVPVEEDKWIHPPFAAHMDSQGRIYGRGTQDMKIGGIQYLEAIRRMKLDGVRLAKTIALTFVPDEEIGGLEGMKLFVETQEFRDLNVGFMLDESVPNENPKELNILYSERHKWSLKFHLTGESGHGSIMKKGTAAEKLSRLLEVMFTFRKQQLDNANGNDICGTVSSINPTIIKGGFQDNVIPSEITVVTDIRLHPGVNFDEWKQTVKDWCKYAGDGVTTEEILCEELNCTTNIDESNVYYKEIVTAIRKLGYKEKPFVCPGISDSRFIRNKGIPALGVCVTASPILAHQHNEYVNRQDVLNGIRVFYEILLHIGNLNV